MQDILNAIVSNFVYCRKYTDRTGITYIIRFGKTSLARIHLDMFISELDINEEGQDTIHTIMIKSNEYQDFSSWVRLICA